MVTRDELNLLAAYMIDTHGEMAVHYADCAAMELDQVGARERAGAWRLLRTVVVDMMAGRLNRDGQTLH